MFDSITKIYFMATEPKNLKKEDKDKKPALKSDPGTTNTTDPQENMKGPVSSVVQKVKEETEDNDESKEDGLLYFLMIYSSELNTE